MTLHNCTVTIGQYIEKQTVGTQYVDHQTVEQQEVETSNRLPMEKDYVGVVEWLKVEKEAGRDHYADANFNRAKMCRKISDILGWEVDRCSMGRAINNTKN